MVNTTKSKDINDKRFESNAVLLVCSPSGLSELKDFIRSSNNFFRIQVIEDIRNYKKGSL